MRIRLSMNGRNSTGRIQVKRTITEQECFEIIRLVLERDGQRPWEQPKPAKLKAAS